MSASKDDEVLLALDFTPFVGSLLDVEPQRGFRLADPKGLVLVSAIFVTTTAISVNSVVGRRTSSRSTC